MRPVHRPPSRSWALPVAGLVVCAAGCTRTAATPEERLAERSGRAIAELERLQPRLAKAGTPDADVLAANLAAVRESLAALPRQEATAADHAADPAADPAVPATPPPPARVRCPDDGCWRLGVQAEVGLWRLHLAGGGDEIDDTGPAALGLAIGLERATPLDHRLEWSWGGELVGSLQDRTGGQRATLVGVRPFARAALAISDSVALTARPLVEIGQASVRLGEAPGGVLDQGGVYGAIGLRAGWRWRLAGGDLTGEFGWREVWFTAAAGAIDYRARIGSPELAVGWSGRF